MTEITDAEAVARGRPIDQAAAEIETVARAIAAAVDAPDDWPAFMTQAHIHIAVHRAIAALPPHATPSVGAVPPEADIYEAARRELQPNARERVLDGLSLAKRPVAFRVRQRDERWFFTDDETTAAKMAHDEDSEYQGLYVRDGT